MSLWSALTACALTACIDAPRPRAPPAPPTAPAEPALPAPSCATQAQSPPPDAAALAQARVALVCFAGNARLPEATLRGLVRARDGELFDVAVVAEDIHRLFASQQLDDVQASVGQSRDGLVLTFTVVERKPVSHVRFEGLHALGADDASAAFRAAELTVLDSAAIRRSLERIQVAEADRGYPYSTFTLRTAPVGDAVELTVVVDEGPEVNVASLAYPGTKRLPKRALDAITTTRSGAPYKAAIFERDVLLVNAAYYDRGMLQASVGPAEVVPSADKRTVAIRVPVTEGPVFRLGAFEIVNAGGAAKEYRPLFKLAVGDVFDRSKVLAGINAVRALLAKRGVHRDVGPELELDPAKGNVALKIVIR